MKNAINNQVGMLGDMFLWLVANLKQGIIYFIKQALPPIFQPGVYSNVTFSRLLGCNKHTVTWLLRYYQLGISMENASLTKFAFAFYPGYA